MSTNKDFIPMKGGYEDSPVYKIARCIYSVTYYFAETYLRRGDRTVDQMVQSARSAKQNIVEGSVDGATSHEMEIKLLNTARGSVHELKADFIDYLTTRGLEQWEVNDPRTQQTRRYCRTHNNPKEYQEACKKRSDETIANIALTLIHQYDVLMVRLIEASKQRFLEHGGIKEEMFRARTEYRSKQGGLSSQSTQSNQSTQSSPRKLISLIIPLLLLVLSGCSDWRNGIADDGRQNAQEQPIAFSGSVVSSQLPTRADATIVHLRETKLPATAASTFYAGIFGCYTGQYTWAELVGAYQTAYAEYAAAAGDAASTDGFLASSKFATFKDSPQGKAYTANMLYNAKATIGDDGTLTYAPLRLWPNNKLESPATGHEYCTFWAYYPYNPTAEIGDYGISLPEERLGQGVGMGRVRFTMQPDAAQQNDFMISALAADCNRDSYPLVEDPQGTYSPKPVPLRFYHMLAQVRLYAYIQGSDRMVYVQEDGKDKVTDETWFATDWGTIKDQYGNVYTKNDDNTVEQTTRKAGLSEADITKYGCGNLTKDEFLELGLKVPDEEKCQRWTRQNIWDKTHTRRRALISYKMEFNNIKTTTTFYPEYSGSAASIAYEPATTLGSATVNDYVMNPYWFHFNDQGQRDYLSDEYMFGIFEEQAAAKAPENNALSYMLGEKNQVDKNDATNHYNFAPGNILLVVPQMLDDDDVPHIVLTATGPKEGTYDPDHPGGETEFTARLTINMLKMNIEWKSGYIYCYAILDDLRPGDDIVRGPESITSIFDTSQYTDQW